MSVCVAAQFPWFNITHLPGLDMPGVVVCSDTRVVRGLGKVLPFFASKQNLLSRNIFVCYTSTNVYATFQALGNSFGTKNVKAIAASLREAHSKWGGYTELLAIVWTRKFPPQILELMPPGYGPKPRSGIVGIGDREVLTWMRDNFPKPNVEAPISADALEKAREFFGEFTLPEPSFSIDEGGLQVVAAFSEAISQVGSPTVALPIQAAVINRGTVRPLSVHSSGDLESWTELTIGRDRLSMPKLSPVRVSGSIPALRAVQLFT